MTVSRDGSSVAAAVALARRAKLMNDCRCAWGKGRCPTRADRDPGWRHRQGHRPRQQAAAAVMNAAPDAEARRGITGIQPYSQALSWGILYGFRAIWHGMRDQV